MKTSLIIFILFFIFSLIIIFLYKEFSLGIDIGGGIVLIYQIDWQNIDKSQVKNILDQTKNLIEKRINFWGVKESSISFSESGRIFIEIPNIKDLEEAKNRIGKTAFLEFRIPQDNKFIPSGLTGKHLKGAEILLSDNQLNYSIGLEFDSEGAKIFKDLTQKYLGKPIAIYLDGQLISSPVVESVIENGRAQITGNFSLKEAKILSDLLNSGALPVNLKLIGESIVNPIFSAEILNIALYGSILGIVLVFIFMVVFYGFYGLLADIALVFFLVFNLAFYKILGVTISLSSLSGLVLAVGMAVDANILIFERIKEESKRGLKMKDLIEEGFNRAFPSIRDSNMTTIISSLLMYYLATSFVKGFALTLLFGVIISFVTAVFFTKYLLEIAVTLIRTG